MLIIPAIDILGGKCVRLYKGDYRQVSVYEKDPVTVAREFEQAGAKRIHIVDLDAVMGEGRRNRKKIRKIRKAVSCTIELGGGIRSEEDVEELLEIGINRLVVGTIFARNPSRVAGWAQHYGSVFIAGIDSLEGQAKINGWEKRSGNTHLELAKKAREVGVCSIIYTDIARDGTMEGPDTESAKKITQESGLPVILSGGVGTVEDVKKVAENSFGIVGIIAGKAFYEGKLNLEEVIRKYQRIPEREVWW